VHLYALCDQDLLDNRGLSLTSFVDIAVKHDAKIIQYRNKNSDISFIKQQLILIRNLYKGILIVNDLYELSDFCDGVHLGQEDLMKIDTDIEKAVNIVRNSMLKDKLIGISTHNEKEILQANRLEIDYIGLGAYRDTETKKNITAILGDDVKRLASLSKYPVGVIGGVRLDDKFDNIKYLVIGSGLLK